MLWGQLPFLEGAQKKKSMGYPVIDAATKLSSIAEHLVENSTSANSYNLIDLK